jgi:hypothetical protein
MRFVPLQHTLAAARCPHLGIPGRMPTVPDVSRFGVFAAGPRACFARPDGVRPCGFALEGGRVSVSTVWRTFGVPCVDCSFFGMQHVAKWNHRSSDRNRCGLVPVSKRSRLRVHINRRRLAPSRIGSVIRRGRFSHATFRTFRDPPLPGRAAYVLPSCRPAALLGLHPSQVCSRPAGGLAGIEPHG